MSSHLGGDRPLSTLLAVGEAMLVLFNEHVGALQPGALFRTGVGGAELNVALSVAHLGGTAEWLGVLGDDAAGDVVLGRLVAGGVSTRHVRRSPHRTGLLLRERRSALGSRVHYWRHDSAGSRLDPTDIDSYEFGSDTLVHLTGITPALSVSAADAANETLHRARAAGAYISFDVNYRSRLWEPEVARATLQPFLSADLVFATEAEARLMLASSNTGPTGEAHALDLAMALHELGGATVVIKRGRDGAVMRASSGVMYIAAAPPVPAIDTVGAGDAFVGGFLSALLRGAGHRECLDQAVRAGAYAVTVLGDSEVLATPSDLHDIESEDPDAR